MIGTHISCCSVRKVVEEGELLYMRDTNVESGRLVLTGRFYVLALILQVSASFNGPGRRLCLRRQWVYSTQAGCSHPHMIGTRNISSPTHRAQSAR